MFKFKHYRLHQAAALGRKQFDSSFSDEMNDVQVALMVTLQGIQSENDFPSGAALFGIVLVPFAILPGDLTEILVLKQSCTDNGLHYRVLSPAPYIGMEWTDCDLPPAVLIPVLESGFYTLEDQGEV